MHVFFAHGVAGYTVKLVINHFVENNMFTVEDLNGRIHSYDYGDTEIKNKPLSNFTRNSLRYVLRDHTLKQKAAQMILLVRVLPFILSDWVPDDDPPMRVLLPLVDIMNIVFAPKLHRDTIS